jgi:hypothetical protein
VVSGDRGAGGIEERRDGAEVVRAQDSDDADLGLVVGGEGAPGER